MAKIKPVRVNLSTQAREILATMREEMPAAYYQFRKNFGGKRKYFQHEDQMLDKALEEKNDQFTDIDYWISRVGNRWMTYTQAEYYPKAQYANAFHFAFIYYETMASCGAFFPMYDPKKTKKGKVVKEAQPDGVILYTDHFFYQMSERTKIEYRSKELIKKFVSTRLENAMTIADDGEVIVKFKGGHGFGNLYSENPKYIAIRTFLKDEELNGKQRKMCEPVDTLYELVKDGTYMPDVAISAAAFQDLTSEEVIKDTAKRMEAMKKLGMEGAMMLHMSLCVLFLQVLEDILHIELNQQQQAVIGGLLTMRAEKFMKKWIPLVDDPEKWKDREQELQDDMVDVCSKVAKDMKLKYVNRDTITKHVNEIMSSSMEQKKSEAQ